VRAAKLRLYIAADHLAKHLDLALYFTRYSCDPQVCSTYTVETARIPRRRYIVSSAIDNMDCQKFRPDSAETNWPRGRPGRWCQLSFRTFFVRRSNHSSAGAAFCILDGYIYAPKHGRRLGATTDGIRDVFCDEYPDSPAAFRLNGIFDVLGQGVKTQPQSLPTSLAPDRRVTRSVSPGAPPVVPTTNPRGHTPPRPKKAIVADPNYYFYGKFAGNFGPYWDSRGWWYYYAVTDYRGTVYSVGSTRLQYTYNYFYASGGSWYFWTSQDYTLPTSCTGGTGWDWPATVATCP
jgi:hypothetical protein